MGRIRTGQMTLAVAALFAIAIAGCGGGPSFIGGHDHNAFYDFGGTPDAGTRDDGSRDTGVTDDGMTQDNVSDGDADPGDDGGSSRDAVRDEHGGQDDASRDQGEGTDSNTPTDQGGVDTGTDDPRLGSHPEPPRTPPGWVAGAIVVPATQPTVDDV